MPAFQARQFLADPEQLRSETERIATAEAAGTWHCRYGMAFPNSEPLRVRTARDAADLLAPTFAGATRERLAILYLSADRVVLGVSETRLGEKLSIELPLRAIIADALRLGAVGLIIAHNHPSGDPMPSAADQAATRKLIRVACDLGIQVHDHLVFAGMECRSFRALDLL